MPSIEKINHRSVSKELRTLDREQLEYTAKRLFVYGVLAFFTLGTLASITYLTVEKLKK